MYIYFFYFKYILLYKDECYTKNFIFNFFFIIVYFILVYFIFLVAYIHTSKCYPVIEAKIDENPFSNNPVTEIDGCYVNGKVFRSGETISSNYDKTSNWCYGTYCSESGSIINWDNWNCKKFSEVIIPTPRRILITRSKTFRKFQHT